MVATNSGILGIESLQYPH